MKAVIRFDQLIMHEYMQEVYYKIHSFSFYGPHMLEENIEDRVLESNVLKKLLSKNNNGWFA